MNPELKAGLYLQKEFKECITRLEHSIEHAKLLNDGLLGNIRFGYVGSAMQQVIQELLQDFTGKGNTEYV